MYTLKNKKKTAHEMKLAFSNFHNMMEPLEEYIEKAHSNSYPDFKNKRQRYKKTITNDRPADRLEDLFLTQLFIIKGAIDKEAAPFKEDLKEDFYKWINHAGITAENCPEKLAHFLIEINNVLNGNGEKIVEQTRELIKGQEINPWDMPQIFGDLQGSMNRNREQGRNLAGKNWNEVEIEGRFRGSAELGKQVFEQITRKFSNHDNVNFFSQKPQQIRNPNYKPLLDDPSEEFLSLEQEGMEGIEGSTSTDTKQCSKSVLKETKVNTNKLSKDNSNKVGTIATISLFSALVIGGLVLVARSKLKKVKK